jgi:hypothetical protein
VAEFRRAAARDSATDTPTEVKSAGMSSAVMRE